MKTCFKCGQEKELSDFYSHPRMADGHVNKCKECNKRDMRRHHRKQESPKARKPNPNRKVYHYERKRASNALNNAIRDGKVVKDSNCAICQKEGRVEGHHYDYSKPLEVLWLCPRCHRQHHNSCLFF